MRDTKKVFKIPVPFGLSHSSRRVLTHGLLILGTAQYSTANSTLDRETLGKVIRGTRQERLL